MLYKSFVLTKFKKLKKVENFDILKFIEPSRKNIAEFFRE